jgi:hypothetical protein
MPKLKLLLSVLLGMAVVFAQVGPVLAAPRQQDGTLYSMGTIQTVVVEPGVLADDPPTVVVTLLENGSVRTIRITLAAAIDKGLILLDEMGNPILDENLLPTPDDSLFGATDVEIFLEDVVPETPVVEEPKHPVGEKIAKFFADLFEANDGYDMVMDSHSSGIGFGVITQALWMTQALGGDASLFEDLLYAKQNNDYDGLTLPGEMEAANWGQLKKAVSTLDPELSGVNLGQIMSAGQGKDQNTNNGNGKPENPGNGKPENPGNGNVNSNRPATPPGQDKEKDNGNNDNGKIK